MIHEFDFEHDMLSIKYNGEIFLLKAANLSLPKPETVRHHGQIFHLPSNNPPEMELTLKGFPATEKQISDFGLDADRFVGTM